MKVFDLITKKKNKKTLTKEEIDFFISGVMANEIKDYEASAFLMATAINGMTIQETYDLTMAMANSGDVVDFEGVKGPIIDKHSTGGVSDTTTLVIMPIIASLGVKFAKMSGSSLGFTGGTADKLQVFTGYNLNLTQQEFKNTINTVGGSVITQTKNLAPADKILYDLRNKTASVESMPLIAASIMSKKLASNADVIVLDVKFGKGAFMKTQKQATVLAKTMVEIGKKAGKKVSAILTDMNDPLGSGIGNNLEVKNAINVLKGKRNNLATVSKKLCEQILLLSNTYDLKTAKKAINDSITSGNALLKLQEIIRSQGGDDQIITRTELMQKPKFTQFVVAKKNGFVNSFKTKELGYIVSGLKESKTSKIIKSDHAVGIKLFVKRNTKVKTGDKLAEIQCNSEEKLLNAQKQMENVISIGKNKKTKGKLIQAIIK
jgi:pyrimidine-nucleoside phosphorylase